MNQILTLIIAALLMAACTQPNITAPYDRDGIVCWRGITDEIEKSARTDGPRRSEGYVTGARDADICSTLDGQIIYK